MSIGDYTEYDRFKKQLIKDVTIVFHNTGYSVTWNREIHPVTDVYTTLDQVKKALDDAESVNGKIKKSIDKITTGSGL